MKQRITILKTISVVSLFLCVLCGGVYAQELGNISGTVTDTMEAETVIGAVVVVEGNNTLGAFTDTEGKFIIKNVKPGTYNISITYFGLKPLVVKDVKVKAGETTELGDLFMYPDAAEGTEVVIVGTKTTNTEQAAVQETKESKQVVNVISAEQISKSQDRDAAQVMQRVPGVTIIDSRFVMIRGLSERYNVVMINDAIAPNTEVDRRSFSFDLIPSQMLDRMSVYKSGAADMPGDFAAGVIKIYTRNMPDKNYFNVSLTGGFRPGTTFKDYNTNFRGGTEFLGFGDKSRNLPDDFPTSTQLNAPVANINQIQRDAALQLPNRFGYKSYTALPDLRLNVDFGRRFTIGRAKVGNVTSVNYSNTYQRQTIDRYEYDGYSDSLQRSSLRSKFIDDRTLQTIRLGVIHNWSIILNPNNKLDFKNLFNQQSENETILREGVLPADYALGDTLRAYSYRYTSRSIFTSQLGGRHDSKSQLSSFTWNVGYSYINRNVPDWIRFRTLKVTGDSIYKNINPSAAALFENARFNSSLKENVIMTSGAYEHKFAKNADSTGVIVKAGYYIETRSRDFEARWMSLKAINSNQVQDSINALPIDQLFSSNIISLPNNGWKLVDGTNPTDKYTAGSELYSGFLSALAPIKKFTIQAGFRLEAYRQKLTSVGAKIDTFIISPLPFFNASYNLTKKSLFRVAYSRTLNRPEFRELAPFVYYDFDLNTNFIGEPKLKICDIHNIDARWEYYPSAAEMISVGVFYKRFNNPIEQTSFGTTPRQFTFSNAAKAENYGVELEVRKSLEGLTTARVIKDISILFNASLINSKVSFNFADSAQRERSNRPLQGQSPYVINTGLYYFNDKKDVSISLMYNVFGKRIFIVGIQKNEIGNIYEMPRHLVDLTIQKKLTKRLEGRIGIQDLLNYKIRFMQDSNDDLKITSVDEPFMITRRGSYINFGMLYKF